MSDEKRVTISLYNDSWFDNGLITFYNILEPIDEDLDIGLELTSDHILFVINDEENFVKELIPEIDQARNDLIVIDEDDKGVEKEVKKDFLILQEGKKVDGKVSFRERFFDKEKRKEFIKNSINILTKDGGKRNCIVCGRQYNVKGDSVKRYLKLKQSINPLSTKIKSLSGVRSYKNDKYLKFSKTYHDNLCPLCYMIGVLNWGNRGLIYRTFISDDHSYVLLPKMKDLVSLNDFRNSYYDFLNHESRYSNIKVKPDMKDTENTSGKFSTLLCFYEKFLFNTEGENLCTDWEILKIPLGNVKNVTNTHINVREGLLETLKTLLEEGTQIYNHFIDKVTFFKDTNDENQNVDWDITNEIKENLSEYYLKDDFDHFARTLLPKHGGSVGYSSDARNNLEKLLEKWRLKDMGLEKENLEHIKKVGNIIAKTSGNAPTLLYKVDKARNFEDLLDALRQVSRKMAGLDKDEIKGKISPGALNDLIEILNSNRDEWKDIRNLLVIYSSMYYSIGKLENRGE
ncbi:MAG: hypothetical protein ACOCTT_03995 [archaeon]